MRRTILALCLATGLVALATAGDDETNAGAPPGLALWETATSPRVEATPEVMVLGKRIYGMRCALCHGQEGAGDGPAALWLDVAPRDFSKGLFKFRTTKPQSFPSDEDLLRSITTGFPVYGMPAFGYLSAKERWALVHYLKALVRKGLERELAGDEEAEEIIAEIMAVGPEIAIPPEPAGEPDLKRGRELYVEHCGKCHGDTGKGDGESVTEDLKDNWGHVIRPRDMVSGRSYRKVGWRARDTVRMILLGVGGTPMPAIDIKPDTPEGVKDMWALARYTETLERKR